MTYEELTAALATGGVDEDRVPERVEIERATPDVYMVRAYFVGEEEFDTFHVGLA